MVIIGADPSKSEHCLIAIDAGGRKVGQKTIPATTPGHLNALRWARATYGPDITWAIEDVRNVSARLERDLMDAGARVVRVPTRLMARTRATGRAIGKSDPIDALAVARVALREPSLPTAYHDPISRQCKLLVGRRDVIVEQRTATVHRLMWRLHELDPTYSIAARRLYIDANRVTLRHWLQTQADELIASLACEELADIAYLTAVSDRLEGQIKQISHDIAPSLLEIRGCGPLLAAKIVAEAAGITRFANGDAFARYCGVGPMPRWSGRTAGRMRYTRTGNRQLNMALDRIAMIQIRDDSQGAVYYRRRIATGDSPAMARRCLKRHLARVVYRALVRDRRRRSPSN